MTQGIMDVALYGDESHFNEVVTYAFIIIPQKKHQLVESYVNKVKKRFGVDEGARIHCRELFNKHARSKTYFSELTNEMVLKFLDEIMIQSFIAGARGWVGYMDARKAPDSLLFDSENAAKPLTLHLDNLKTKMHLCFHAAIGPLTHIFPPTRVKSYVDGDKTKILFLNQKRQVDNLRSFFPVEHKNEMFFSEPVHGLKPLFLDLADILAYAAARGLAEASTGNKDSFISMVKSLDPGYSEVVFDLSSAGGAMFNIRAFDPDDRVKSYINQFIQH
ncbi:hypothetical protein KHP07_19355 [Pseudomonas sp. VS40]|uniref:hypothetical protein n=1 Tax=unclassified Pseudomonas TaxID=196821 RepID=UPI001BDF2195|nr:MULTISPECIES: hypothetical protein [unclassified Pseudomonas]MBT1262531.1 hypothetical protein [Pseudomonas sp. VS40]MBT1274532.1 hypothetical protein [Pseudomonas sp. VS59]